MKMRVQLGIAVCLVWAVAVAVAEEESILEEQDTDFVDDAVEESKPVVALKKNGATARTWDWAKKVAKYMGYDYDDYEDEEYYDYYYPVQYEPQYAAAGHHGGGHDAHGGSSYVSYQQHHPNALHHSPARDDYITDDDDWNFTDMMLDMAMTVVPIGLILAAIPSGIFTFAVRRRSFGDNLLDDSFDSFNPDEMPILRDILENDWLALTSRECQERLFCDIAQLGEKDESSSMQKFFYYASSLTPDFVARKAGLTDVFRAARYGQCEIFRCGPTAPEEFAPVSNDLAPTNNNTEADLTEPTKE